MANTATLAGINSTIISDLNGHSLLVLDDSGHALYSLQDVMEGLTLIDIDDMLNRLPPESVAKVSGKWFIHADWIDYILHYARNPKAYKFNEWLLKEVKPMVKEFLMTNAAAKTDATKTDAARMIPAAAQTDTAKMTVEAPKTNIAKITSIASLVKHLGINNEVYYGLLKANNASTNDFKDKDGAFTEEGIKRLKEMLAARKVRKYVRHKTEQLATVQLTEPEIIAESSVREFVSERFGKLRTVMRDDEPWFVAADVCRALELDKVDRALSRLDADEKDTHPMSTPGGKQKMSIINEPGLYGLVLGSRKKEAKAFQRWVKHDVLPSIRKHGAYATPTTLREMLASPDNARILLETLVAEQEKNAALQQKIEADAPKVAFADAVEDKGGNLTLGDFAKLLYNDDTPTGRTRFIRWLRANGYFIQSAPLPYQQYIDLGWFLVRLKEIPNGNIVSVALVTPKGQMALTNAFKRSAQIA